MYMLSLGQVPITYQNMRDIVGEAPLHNAARGGAEANLNIASPYSPT